MKGTKIIIGKLLLIQLCVVASWGQFSCNRVQNFTPSQLDSLKMLECKALLDEIQDAGADSLVNINWKPKSFEQCIRALDDMIGYDLKEWIKCLPPDEFSRYTHMGLGLYIRNEWGLWADSELHATMSEMGIFHPDDMSAVILNSYQRRLKGEEIGLEEQVKKYQDYWREQGVPVDSLLEKLRKSNQVIDDC